MADQQVTLENHVSSKLPVKSGDYIGTSYVFIIH